MPTAVAFDAAAYTSGNCTPGSPDSLVVSTTLGADGYNMLWIQVFWQDDGTGLEGTILDSVTVDGTPATFYASTAASGYNEVYYFPITVGGNHTVTISAAGDGGINFVLGVSSYKNAFSLGTAGTAVGSGTAISASVTGTSTDNMVADAVQIANSSPIPSLTPGSGQVQDWQTFYRVVRGASSHKASAVGTVTMSWTSTQIKSWGTVVGELRQGAPSAAVSSLPLLGTG